MERHSLYMPSLEEAQFEKQTQIFVDGPKILPLIRMCVCIYLCLQLTVCIVDQKQLEHRFWQPYIKPNILTQFFSFGLIFT